MLGQTDLHAALHAAVGKLLRPVVRLLLRHSVPYSAFESIAKRVYVDVAMTEFPLPGRKPSASRASILTGLTRKDVQHLLAEPEQENDTAATQYNRASRVLTAWGRDPEFHASHGKPRALKVEETTASPASSGATAATCPYAPCSTNCSAWAPCSSARTGASS